MFKILLYWLVVLHENIFIEYVIIFSLFSLGLTLCDTDIDGMVISSFYFHNLSS